MNHVPDDKPGFVSSVRRIPAVFSVGICLLLTLLTLQPAMAESDIQLRVGGYSHHLMSDGFCEGRERGCQMDNWHHYNQDNQSYGLEYKGLEFSTMVNSYHERSLVAGYNWHLLSALRGHLDFDVFTGAATGYQLSKASLGGVLPVIHPRITAWYGQAGLELGTLITSVTLSFKVRL